MSTLVSRHNHHLVLDAEQHVGAYGPGTSAFDPEDGEHFVTYRAGLLSEHVNSFVAAGGSVRPAASGSGVEWAVLPDGRVAATVVCPQFIPVMTEDGPSDGRCGVDATVDGLCAYHAEEVTSWLS